MGKTTYCQKLSYDWANRQEEWDEFSPENQLLLLLRCHDIETNIWEAIDEQILPEDIDKESKENFFKFIRENQSKVLLVLDGLDEVGVKFRRFCHTLWKIVGFTTEHAESFIFKYF